MRPRSTPSAGSLAILALLLSAFLAGPPVAAQDRPNEEPSSFDTLMDRTDMGNVAQTARMAYHTGVRELEQARKLEEKAAETPEEAKRAKHQKRALASYERAIESLTDALRTQPTLVEAYDPLGRAFLATGRPEEALSVYAAALRLAPELIEAKEGLGEALLEAGRVRDAAAAYESLRGEDGEAAARLLAAMRRWVDRHRETPEPFSPEVVEAVATLVQQWEQES
ncbi:MAG: tetratricopeptide repeat protein [Thermoanaerobaculia bacterium]|nr:tetratricopeptide repeat protein [Thermoanaerobaculia bacterium]